MSEHTYRRVEKSYQQGQSRFSGLTMQAPIQQTGQVMVPFGEYDYQNHRNNPNLHYELTYKSVSYPSQASFQDLGNMKDVLLDLIDEFKHGNKRVIIDGEKKNSYEKRLLLLEHELNGLMKQRIIFEAPDREGGTRKLDYGVLLNEKQNQIVELQKKIHNLEERLRRASQRQLQLENEITFIHSKLKSKNLVIESKQRQLSEEVAYSHKIGQILSDIKSSASGSNELSKIILKSASTLDRNEIRTMTSRVSSSMRGNDYASSEIMKLARGLENLSSKKSSIEEVQGFVEGWILGLSEECGLRRKVLEGEQRLKNEERVKVVDEKFKYAGQIYRRQIDNLRRAYPEVQIAYDEGILNSLRDSSSRVSVGSGGLIEVEKSVVKTVEVPVQDARTKHLIYQFATEMKKIYTKYPKLYKQIDPRLAQFFSQELIDVVSVDEVDRLVSIVKYEPQVVRVQNVYAYSSEKSRKVQFHLRVLLKALLTEMQKIIVRTGVVPEIDEGVIGLIKQQIMDVVDIDDILKVYRTVPKIVEVEKVVEKIVEKIVEVPKLVPTQHRVQVPVEVRKVEVVENVVNVPLNVPTIQTLYVEKLVEVPRIVEKIVQVEKVVQNNIEVIKEVPKIIQVDREVQKIVEVVRPEFVVQEKIVQVFDYKPVTLEVEKIVPTEKVIEVIKPIEVFIDRVQEVVKEIIKVVEVEKIKEVIVQKPVYYPAPQVTNNVIVKEVPVDRIIEKIVPIIKVQDRIVEIQTVAEKIVEVRDIIREPYQVQVVRQVPIIQEAVKVVEKVVQKAYPERFQVEKIVQKFIQVPIVQQKIRVEKQYIKEPVIQTVQSVIHKQVQIEKPVVLYQDRIVEVQKIINHIVAQPQIINILQERVVPLETVVKEPIPVPTIIQKIVEKLVEVPKVVEVQKIVEKIIPVPRVVEKVIQVEKIVEKIVNKLVIEEKLKQVERRVEIPVFSEKVVEIEIPRNVYIENQVPVKVLEQKMVKDEVRIEIPKIHEIDQPPQIVVQTKQVPRDMYIQKIVPLSVPETNIVYLDRQITVPIEIQVPVDMIKEKFVPVEHTRQQILQIERIRQIPAPQLIQPDPRVVEVPRYEERPYKEEIVKTIVDEKPYFNTVIQEVKTTEEKVVTVEKVHEKLLRTTQFVDRVVDRVISNPKIYEVEKKVEKLVEKERVVQIEKIVPHIVNVNSYIETIAQKIIDIPILYEKLKEIDRKEEVIVAVSTTQAEIHQVDRNIERAVIQEKLKQAVDKVHTVEEVMKVAEKVVLKDADPVLISQDKIMQVPFIVEKIVEKIVVMPQIVQVLKYVHEIAETQSLGVAVSSDLGTKQVQYKTLAGNVRSQLNGLLAQLKVLWNTHSQLRVQIQIIQKFLAQFEKLILYPKIHEIIRQVEVEKEVERRRVVPVPVGGGEQDTRMELSKAILIEKLITELKRIKEENPRINLHLDEDIKLIFGSELNTSSNLVGGDFNKLISEYSTTVQSKFKSMGGWTMDHQFMLNSFLEQRFLMANVLRTANSDLNKTKAISQKRLESMRKYKYERDEMQRAYNMLNSFLPQVLEKSKKTGSMNHESIMKADQWMSKFTSILVTSTIKGGQPTRVLGGLEESRLSSVLRQKQEEVYRLKDQIAELLRRGYGEKQIQYIYKQVPVEGDNYQSNSKIRDLQSRIREYELKIRDLQMKLRSANQPSSPSDVNKSGHYLEKISILEREIERLKIIQRSHKECDHTIEKLKIQISILEKKLRGLKDSRTLGSPQFDSDRHQSSSSSSSSYGVNYMDYASIDEQANRGIGQIQGTHQIYRSTYAQGGGREGTGGTVGTVGMGGIGGIGSGGMGGIGTGTVIREGTGGFTQMSQSRGQITEGSQRYQTNYTVSRQGSGEGGEGASYRSFEYSRQTGSNRNSGMRQAYETSQIQEGDSRSSDMYHTSSKEIIRRTKYEREQ